MILNKQAMLQVLIITGRLAKLALGVSDAKFKIMSVKQVFEMVMDNQDQFPNICMIENIRYTESKYGHLGRDWFHFAVSSLPVDKIHVFKP